MPFPEVVLKNIKEGVRNHFPVWYERIVDGGLQIWILKRSILVDPRFRMCGGSTSSISTTPIVDKIRKLEKIIIDGKATLVDEEGKPLKMVNYPSDHDSEDEVESVDNDMACFRALERVGFGTNS
ncbi:hypothetical protein Tco_0531636 [Tanacetum coccineum]